MKYKVIKEYPGSPSTGLEFVKTDTGYKRSDLSYDLRNWIIPKDIENWKEYWELVQEVPEYVKCIKPEVWQLTCSANNGVIFNTRNHIPYVNKMYSGLLDAQKVNFEPSTKEAFDLQELQNSIKNMKHGEWYIIKSLYNWLFKFDKIENEYLFTLKSKCLDSTSLYQTPIKFGRIANIKSISPATQQEVEQYFPNEFRKPLFVTEDGVDIFKGDRWWFIYMDNIGFGKLPLTPYIDNSNYDPSYGERIKRFSTKEKAQEYLDSLKPKKETLLEKAKRLYKSGVKFNNDNLTGMRNGLILIPNNITYIESKFNTIWLVMPNGNKWTLSDNGKWAEIISETPITENKQLFTKEQQEFIEQLINNKIKELQ